MTEHLDEKELPFGGIAGVRVTTDLHPCREYLPSVDGGPPTEYCPIKDQRMIRINGIHAGYYDTKPGGSIYMIRRYPEPVLEEVRRVVEAEIGKVNKIGEPAEIPQEILDQLSGKG